MAVFHWKRAHTLLVKWRRGGFTPVVPINYSHGLDEYANALQCSGFSENKYLERAAHLWKKKSSIWRVLKTKISNILVPHDGEQMSDKALLYALEIARGVSAKVTLLHIIEEVEVPPFLFLGSDQALIANAKRSIKMEMEQKWQKFSQEKMKLLAGDKVTVSSHALADYDASDAILRFAEDNNIDLIIMGSRRLQGLAKPIAALGSVARKVSEGALCPVMLIH